MVQEDITKMEAALEQLKAAGADLFADEITALQGRINVAKLELEQGGKQVEKETESWWMAHRADFFNVLEIAGIVYLIYRVVSV